ncbi:MAG: helix-turn-helix transcriptional regulator [Minisyncoccales bacterium]
MAKVNLKNMENLKNQIFKNRPDVKEEYENKSTIRKLQKEIIKARIDRGLTQKELADLAGTTQSSISRLESDDDYNPNLKTLIKISEALNKSLKITFY